MNIFKLSNVVAAVVFLAGCAGEPVAMSTVAKDKKKFLNDYFSPSSVSESVIKKLPKEDLPTDKEVKFIMNSKLTFSDSKDIERVAEITYVSAGNGLVKIMSEFSRNEIPLVFTFNINYKGLLDLKWVNANPAFSMTSSIHETKEISRIDHFPTAVGQEMNITYKWATEMQITNFNDGQHVCKTLRVLSAKELHKKLSGEALELQCEQYSNGISIGRDKFIYFKDLGYAVNTEVIRASTTDTRSIKDVIGI